MADNPQLLDTPEKIAQAGERFYAERHKAKLEASHNGQFVAINVLTGDAYVGQFSEMALEAARKAAPNGVFHLIRIGSPGAFRVSYSTPGHGFWTGPLRSAR